MKGQQRQHWEQLDLRLPDKKLGEHRTLDPETRKEITQLLGLLLGTCATGAPRGKEASNEQDQR
jgi:hypothetical protein